MEGNGQEASMEGGKSEAINVVRHKGGGGELKKTP